MNANKSEEEKLSKLTDLQLKNEEKSRKSLFFVSVILIVLMVVVAVITTIKNGSGFFSFLPLFFIPMVYNAWRNLKILKEEISTRKKE